MDLIKGQKEIQELLDHVSQARYVCAVEWKDEGDLVIWDNTCVLYVLSPVKLKSRW
jgi:alpha-ketoglutarate-dependent 2,4-dichlorophenoxyacetate dioxygenase